MALFFCGKKPWRNLQIGIREAARFEDPAGLKIRILTQRLVAIAGPVLASRQCSQALELEGRDVRR